MIGPLILALLLPLSPVCAAEGPAADVAPAVQSADPALLGMEKDLAGKLEEKNNATLNPEDYQSRPRRLPRWCRRWPEEER